MRIAIVGLLLALTSVRGADTPQTSRARSVQQQVRAYREAHEREMIDEYLKFLSIPNTAFDRPSLLRNAQFIADMLRARGVAARLLPAPIAGVPPAVYGEILNPGATRTILFYAHYDGQPVNPAQWAPGWEPFRPQFVTAPAERGGTIVADWKPGDAVNPQWRITGRGSADDKAGVMTILNGLAALIGTGARPTVNLKFFFEGEEESGSPHLGAILGANRAAAAADLWVIVDGQCHFSGQKQVVFGVRGDVNVGLTVYGPRVPLHSGHFGNWAPNPAWRLVNLLASMKDEHGRVLIEGFDADVIPPTDAERRALAAIPPADAGFAAALEIPEPEVPGRSLLEGYMLPSLNINGIQSANVGPIAANVIPVSAKAALDLRLVPGNDAQRQVEKVVAHIKSQGFHVLDRDPTDEERATYPRLIRIDVVPGGYNAQRTALDSPAARAVVEAVQSTVDYPVIRLPSTGGSLPLFVIQQQTGAAVISVPVVNYDNNQHGENENVKVQFLWDGMETCAALFMMP